LLAGKHVRRLYRSQSRSGPSAGRLITDAAIAVVTHDEKIYGRLDHIFQLRDGVLDKEQVKNNIVT
jgi:hypothetical protein